MDQIATHEIAYTHNDVVPAGDFWAKRIAAGSLIRIVDVHGKQAVDFLCYDANNRANSYNAANTIKLNRNIYLGKGSILYSSHVQPLMTVIDDTVGHHDTIAGCCSAHINRFRYNDPGKRNCRDTFFSALASVGEHVSDLPANANFFMHVPVGPGGEVEIADGLSKPGDFVELRCEMDVLVVISNCAQENNSCTGKNPTPVQILVWRPDVELVT